MKTLYKLISVIIVILGTAEAWAQSVQINEVCSKNNTLLTDLDGDFSDWVELYNTTDQPIDLQGYYLTDDSEDLDKWTFPSISIPANGFLLVFTSGKNLQSTELHTNFRLDSDGEEIYLTNSDDIVLDGLQLPSSLEDEIWGRLPDGVGEWRWLYNDSPGVSNNFNDDPTTGLQSGLYQDGQLLQISTVSGDSVYFTLDGQDPSWSSLLYTEGLMLEEIDEENDISLIPTTPPNYEMSYHDWQPPEASVPKGHLVKFATFRNGEQTSEVKSRFVFVNDEIDSFHDLPVISISTNEEFLFDSNTGIYVPGEHFNPENPEWTGNYFERGDEWERPVDFKYISAEGSLLFEQRAGLRIHGGKTRQAAQKSLRLYAREEYGERYFEYAMLPGRSTQRYKRFILRTTMGAWHNNATIRDVVAHQVIKNLDLEYQEYDPVVVFLNGEYWGVHTLRDRPDERYIEYLTGVSKDSVEIIRASQLDLLDFIETYDLKDDLHYAHVSERLDISNCIDYFIAEMFLANYDWPHNNWRLWREKSGGKWRSIFYDIDGGVHNCDLNMVKHLMNDSPGVLPNPWSTVLFRGLIRNEDFRIQFLNRFADLLSTEFQFQRVDSIINNVFQKYTGEMARHIERWNYPADTDTWEEDCLGEMKSFFKCRPCEMTDDLVAQFPVHTFPFSCADDSVSQGNDSPFVVFPNPSSGIFRISARGQEIEEASLLLYTSDGRLVKAVDNFSLKENEMFILNLQNTAQGIFILHLETKFITDVRRLVVH